MTHHGRFELGWINLDKTMGMVGEDSTSFSLVGLVDCNKTLVWLSLGGLIVIEHTQCLW